MRKNRGHERPRCALDVLVYRAASTIDVLGDVASYTLPTYGVGATNEDELICDLAREVHGR
jgi:hypothetical protein